MFLIRSTLAGKKSDEMDIAGVNIIVVSDKKDEANCFEAKKTKPISSPHIVNLEDIVSNMSEKHLKSAKATNSVITIHGTEVSETKISFD